MNGVTSACTSRPVRISDVRMPRMSGFELVKKINEANGHRPPVILITGSNDLTLREAQDLGAQAILEKPIVTEDLLHEVRRALTRSSSCVASARL